MISGNVVPVFDLGARVTQFCLRKCNGKSPMGFLGNIFLSDKRQGTREALFPIPLATSVFEYGYGRAQCLGFLL